MFYIYNRDTKKYFSGYVYVGNAEMKADWRDEDVDFQLAIYRTKEDAEAEAMKWPNCEVHPLHASI